jgi:hypothetical protein
LQFLALSLSLNFCFPQFFAPARLLFLVVFFLNFHFKHDYLLLLLHCLHFNAFFNKSNIFIEIRNSFVLRQDVDHLSVTEFDSELLNFGFHQPKLFFSFIGFSIVEVIVKLLHLPELFNKLIIARFQNQDAIRAASNMHWI